VHGTWHPIADLSDLAETRGPSGPLPTRLSFAAVGVTLAECVVTLASDSSGIQIMFGGLAAVLVTTLGAIAVVWWRSRPYELWVRCRGEQVMLYTHRDPIEFHKFERALWRAMKGEVPKAYPPGTPMFR
jgi:hypothetical protein